MSDPSRAVIFGRDAETYDRYRPAYPAEAVDYLTGLVSASCAVEVGAGTGKATIDVAHSDLALTCLEPSAEMAEVLSARNLPGVEVVVTTLEDWDGPAHTYDLMFAAQAWHWVDRASAYAKALSLLRPSGALALMWNVPGDRYQGFEDVYARHAPHLLDERDARIHRRDGHGWDEDLLQAGFIDVELFTHSWATDLTPAEYRGLHSTYSDHMLIPESQRTALLDDLERTATKRGVPVAVRYRTDVFSGRAG